MSYIRVIPRDLFNEANLLKCYGQLYLEVEKLNQPGVSIDHRNNAFEVHQSQDDGSLTLLNVKLVVRGLDMDLHRPLNSRSPWPLYLTTEDAEEIPVFTDAGALSADLLRYLKGN